MQIKIDKHLTPVSVDFARHWDYLTLDVDPGKVTIDGEHNLAELLARIEGLEAMVEDLESDVAHWRLELRDLNNLTAQVANHLVFGGSTEGALEILKGHKEQE